MSKVTERGINFFKSQQRPFKVNLVRAAIHLFFQQLVRQYQPVYILRLGATPFQLGLINGVGGIAMTAVAPPIGWLGDRYGIRIIFLLGTPIMILGSLLFAFAYDWTVTIPAVVLALLGRHILLTGCPMVCGSYLKNEERATGRQLCDMITSIPCLAAPMIAAAIVARFGGLTAEGMRPLFFLQAVGLLVSLWWVYMFYADILKKKQVPRSFLKGFKEVFEKGIAIRRWLACDFLFTTSMSMSLVYVPAFVAEVKYGDEFVIGSMTTASMVMPILLALIMGRLADTLGRKMALYLTTSFYCISILILIYSQDVTMLLISGTLQGFQMLSIGTQGALSQELVPLSLLGRWVGIQNLFKGFANICGPIIGGLIWSIIGPEYVFFFLILLESSRITILFTVPETLRMKQRIE